MKLFYCIYIILLNFQSLCILVKAYTPKARHLHSATLIGNKFYILGGDIGSNDVNAFLPSNDFFYLDVSVAFNTTNIPWTDLSNVIGTPKHSRAAVSARNQIIFLFGGGFENSSYGIPLVYTFDTTKSVWNAPVIQGTQPPRRESIHSIIDTTGFINSQGYANPNMYILDISDDFEYKWVTSFDPNPSPVPGYNDPSNSSNMGNSISTGTMVGAIIGASL
ncbi:4015_t:CDS:2, partial [Racocetra persica]